MKYVLFVMCPKHAESLKTGLFKDYKCEERVEGETTVLTFKNITKEMDKDFSERYTLCRSPSKDGLKVHGLRLPI